MTTQVIFTIDKALKERAMKKARAEGMPFSSVLKLAVKAYANDQFSVGVIEPDELNVKTKRKIQRALADIKRGKNLSPRFESAEEFIKYLHSS